jgi:5-methylcytosine-specific restriction endonuclease McrA
MPSKNLKEYNKQYYQKNKEKLIARVKDRYENKKEEILEYHRAYYVENKEKVEQRQKKYNEKNKDRVSLMKKQYRSKNKDKLDLIAKEYRIQHRDKFLLYFRERYQDQKEILLEKGKIYRQNNLEKCKAYHAAYRKSPQGKASKLASHGRRRAQKLNTTSGDLASINKWMKNWKSLQQVECHWCGGIFNTAKCHADHVMPLKLGGCHSLDNMVIACARCNLRKNSLHPDEWVKKISKNNP